MFLWDSPTSKQHNWAADLGVQTAPWGPQREPKKKPDGAPESVGDSPVPLLVFKNIFSRTSRAGRLGTCSSRDEG